MRLLAETATDTLDLRHGRVDLRIESANPKEPQSTSRGLAQDELVLVMRREHPLTTGAMTLERHCSARHVTVSRRGRLHDLVDDLLAEGGWAALAAGRQRASTLRPGCCSPLAS